VLGRPGSEESQSKQWISARLGASSSNMVSTTNAFGKCLHRARFPFLHRVVRGLPTDGQVRYVVRRSCSVGTPADDR
jgi:hypothetical protein